MIYNGKECLTQKDVVLELIFKLRKMGYNIYNIPSKSITRFGNTCNFVKYFLSNTAEELQAIENATA